MASRPASVEPLNGREYFVASGQQSEVTTRIRCRWDSVVSALKPYDRVLHGTVVYDILSIIRPHESDRELVLMCKREG